MSAELSPPESLGFRESLNIKYIFRQDSAVPGMIPRSCLARSLALVSALSMIMAQESTDNCPEDRVSFELVTG